MPPTPQQPTTLPAVSRQHIPSLDGLRGLAILLVIFWHFYSPAWFPGWAGVDLFFVLSGYLITARLAATAGRPDYYSAFYRRRILRVFPLYYTLLITFFLLVHFFMQKENLPTVSFYTTHWLNFFTFTQNWAIIHINPVLANRSLEHTWTLAVEEQFYLIWPLILSLLPTSRRRIHIFLALILFILVIRTVCYFLSPPKDHLFYFNTFFRMDSILAGATIYQFQLLKVTIPRPGFLMAILALLIAAGCVLEKNVAGTNAFFQTIGFTLVAMLFACLLYLAVQPSGKTFTRWLQWPLLRYCGKISYGLYILHYPILFLLEFRIDRWMTAHWPDHQELAFLSSTAICIGLAFLISAASYRYFESYFLRLKR